MALREERPPRVFISYSHDSEEHAGRVLALAFQLRGDGVDAAIDQAVTSPPEGWPSWMEAHIRDDDFVVMVCTETYYRRVVRKEAPGVGLGIAWEGSLIYNHLYRTKVDLSRFVPVLLEGGQPEHVPDPVSGATYYRADTQAGYERLLRRLFNRPAAVLPPVGKAPALPALQPEWTARPPSRPVSPPGPTPPAGTGDMDPDQLLDRLNELLSAQFAEIVFRLRIPPQYLTSPAPQATQAIEVLRYLTREGRLGELELLLGGPRAGARAPSVAPTILFLGASPRDEARLRLGREVREIGRSLREADAGRSIQLAQEWAVRPGDLHAILLRHRPQLIHFSGHGKSDGALCFEDESGSARAVPPEILGEMFAVLGRDVRCVVLNACYAEIQARAIADHVGCVVGMKGAIPDAAATAFASSFYLALAHGEDAATAFALGRNQINVEIAHDGSPRRDVDDGHDDRPRVKAADLPVLVTRPGLDARTIRLVDRPAAHG